MKYDAQNVRLKNGELVLQQNAYSDLDHQKFDPVHIAGMQSRATNILHGTFRTELKLDGYNGGSCASFFWYHDNASELDIEVVTPGTSIVNDTINYTTHPSSNADWTPIPGATLSIPLEDTMDTFRTHRFDCDVAKGVKYYLNDKLMHTDDHNVPKDGGSLQLKLWADGNKWWSGMPSSTNTYLRVKNIIAYYNTTTSLSNQEWHDKCHKEKKQCKAIMKLEDGNRPGQMPHVLPSVWSNHPEYEPTACVGAMSCSTGIGAGPTVTLMSGNPTMSSAAPTVTLMSGGKPTYTGSTSPKVTPAANGPKKSSSSKLSPRVLSVGGVCVGIIVMVLALL